ncbi:unnamed protein product [Polarella glacialis]|uniref:Transmembrane protein n=1 Tax=Polarella glacialis TaxID=89957 RepID=A0A813J9I4_POLGL|nr:unnamed protein product [Polarella glacialis]CAE8670643.1 unnamed protein product [Polarella glacialis]|mmetsp:Transcript_74363/g.120034  ORF Transcript_74363/g.120034 Transcript_74363/m.120034 type:complete len:236 (-) Transcript_74363:89-796(-)|eukprot:CAMPEP_0115085180 /NCGR_PEP_ID=MMETSP0227-20121206/21766_1 /TAXON_ID=89957 /ORGANISM="Polarella glacialis, Strain CCMP 1383" /LENGTH=235 /DNA_ID=CAMNT_0002474257 /DNA_START=80 /DNA_END=787 /DNA_ORIENTATION=-
MLVAEPVAPASLKQKKLVEETHGDNNNSKKSHGDTAPAQWCISLTSGLLGSLVSLCVAANSVRLILQLPDPMDFWEVCSWIGHASVGIPIGIAGCYLEMKAKALFVNARQIAVNRIGATIFYAWLGFYVLGCSSEEDQGYEWTVALRVTGFLAWAVSLGDLLISCSALRAAVRTSREKSQAAEHVTGNCGTGEGGTDIEQGSDSAEASTRSTASSATKSKKPEMDTPQGGWNTVA